MATLRDFIYRLNFVQQNKQHHRKVLLINFYLNGHTLGFH